MSSETVVLVGFENQPNLGIGYLAAVLSQNGFDVEILDFGSGKETLLERILDADPLIVGLSIIFQYYTSDFADLVAFLRRNGVRCMVCAGGHYPSLRSEDVLQAIPGLDCVVRFEGERTLLEMAQRLKAGRDWRDLESIAYLENGEYVQTALRPLIPDLDTLPVPERHTAPYQCLGVRSTSILASRGCPQGCSFCSIRRFYAIPPGRVRRSRSPENVVQEMLQLYEEHDVRIFLFQDDDFSLMSKRDRAWATAYVEQLRQTGLDEAIMWKINCRADEVDGEMFNDFKSAGLFLVYLGLESGNETGLKTLNKHITVDQNREAVDVLKQVGIRYEFGFMLFDPSSTFDLVLENVAFLREICGDGSSPAPFCKMLPYAGTDVEETLREERRLRGDVRHPDYGFEDPQLDAWFEYLSDVFRPWVFDKQSVLSHLRWAWFEIDVLEQFYPEVPYLSVYRERLTALTSRYNEIFFRIIEDSAEVLRAQGPGSYALRSIRTAAEEQRRWLEQQLDYQRSGFFAQPGLPPELAESDLETVEEATSV